MKFRVSGLILCCLMGLAAEARAQVVWDSPTLLPPRAQIGTGVYLVDAHGGGLGVLGTWRGAGSATGVRFGVAEGRRDGIAIFGGLDLVTPMVTESPQLPLDISWFTGIGAGYSEWVVLSVPLGLTIGRTFDAPEVLFTPYLAPKVVADVELGRESEDRNRMSLNLDVDLGFDVQFLPGWMIRVGAALGGRGGLAVGIVF